ncbi:hypothetical protein, partial [Vibrio parahaemolyticus]
IEDARKNAQVITENALKQELSVVESAQRTAQQILDGAHYKVTSELEAALDRKGVSSEALTELENRVKWLRQETESLEEKKAELESGVNLDELWSKQQHLLDLIGKETNRLNELKDVGDKYVKIINDIAIDFKQLDIAEYASLLPERIQKKIKTHRMILEMQNSIEYEAL